MPGGFGAVFWMWVIAIIGGASAFVESTLAQIYKRRDPETGESYGGPSYYIEAALHSRPLAIIFAFSLILTYAGGFNMLASYNLQSTFSGYSFYDPETTPWIIGAILALLVGYCVMGGRQAHREGHLHPGPLYGRPVCAGLSDRHCDEHRPAAPGAGPHLLRGL